MPKAVHKFMRSWQKDEAKRSKLPKAIQAYNDLGFNLSGLSSLFQSLLPLCVEVDLSFRYVGRNEKLKFPNEIPYHQEVCANSNHNLSFIHENILTIYTDNKWNIQIYETVINSVLFIAVALSNRWLHFDDAIVEDEFEIEHALIDDEIVLMHRYKYRMDSRHNKEIYLPFHIHSYLLQNKNKAK